MPRAGRAEVRERTQSRYDALCDPPDENDLALGERFATALRVAESFGSQGFAVHYRARLKNLPIGAGGARSAMILRHVDLMTREPRGVSRADLQALVAAGLSETTIVTLSQIVRYVAFQVPAAAALFLLREDPRAPP